MTEKNRNNLTAIQTFCKNKNRVKKRFILIPQERENSAC